MTDLELRIEIAKVSIGLIMTALMPMLGLIMIISRMAG